MDQHGAHLGQFQELKRGGNWACQSSSKSSTNLLWLVELKQLYMGHYGGKWK